VQPSTQPPPTSFSATCTTAEECHALGTIELGKYRVARPLRATAARPWLEKALQLDPSHPQAQVDLASVMAMQGEARAAEKLLRRVVKSNDKHAGAMHNLARVLFDLEKKAILALPPASLPTPD